MQRQISFCSNYANSIRQEVMPGLFLLIWRNWLRRRMLSLSWCCSINASTANCGSQFDVVYATKIQIKSLIADFFGPHVDLEELRLRRCH